VEDIAGLILDAIASRAKAGGARPPGAVAPGTAVGRSTAVQRPAAPVIVVPAPVPVTSMGRPLDAPGNTPLIPDAPLTLDPSIGPLVPVAPPPHRGLPQLLGSFAEPAPFLRAFVLSEALAPPIALRPPGR